MHTYEEVLSLAKRLPLPDQVRLREALAAGSPVSPPVEVEGAEETITAEEILESEAALQDYWAGHDAGITSDALKQRLFGGKLD